MEKHERVWLGILCVVFIIVNAITISPLVPWQEWQVWSKPVPEKIIPVEVENYRFKLPPQGIEAKANQYVEFVATSKDVTYGFGVFRQDGSLVFQMQVIPGRESRLAWKFDAPGVYDVRSTEYSGPRHPEMFVKNAIRVTA
ncbi:MAG: hypothetical protein AB1597_01440 [Chloroflexota bacterium]